MKKAVKFPIFIFSSFGFVIFCFSSFPTFKDVDRTLPPSQITPTVEVEIEGIPDICQLPDIDPWDSTLLIFFKSERDLKCKRKVPEISKLIDGQIFIYPQKYILNEFECKMRCLLPKDDYNVKYGEWIKVINGTRPKCDIIEVKCFNIDAGSTIYKYVHAQVYRNVSKLPLPPSTPKASVPQKFDVHILVLDSMSASQFTRTMPKTAHILQRNYDAVNFHYLNKIGDDSDFALLMGKSYSSIPKSSLSSGHPSDFDIGYDQVCKTTLDKEQFIEYQYQDDGYVTMMAEEGARGVFNSPNCKGFDKAPTDHYMRPYQIHTALNQRYQNILYNDSCIEPFEVIFDYLKSFIKAYPDKPKFSITWMKSLTDTYQPSLSSSDDYFYRFFNNSQKDFDNSYLFVMSNQGSRKIKEKHIDEDNNPFLFVSVPKPLRSNETLMNQLRENAKERITLYDIYATLNEIAKPSKPRHLNPVIHGSSLLKPLPQPRNCDALRIPFEYCICPAKKALLQNTTIGITAANLIIDQINEQLFISNYTFDICSKLVLDKSAKIDVEDFGGEQTIRVYRVTFSVTHGDGRLSGIISYNPKNEEIEIISSIFPMLNAVASFANRQICCRIVSVIIDNTKNQLF